MNKLSAVFRFELRRSLTIGRLAWWLVLAAFPVLITVLVLSAQNMSRQSLSPLQANAIWSTVLYMLVPGVCCALSVFLHTAPAVASELEQRSWVYLATRPRGILWLLLGKYAVAVLWAITAAAASVSVSILLCNAPAAGRIWATMVQLSVLSSFSYGALYMMIGAMFPRRAMVFSVAYTALVEVFLTFIPAVVNRLTIQYRLRSLFRAWMDKDLPAEFRNEEFSQLMFAEGPATTQVCWLILMTALFLLVALIVAHKREFTAASESDV